LGGVGMIIIGLFGYDPSATSNDETAVLALRVVFAIVPAVFGIIAALMMFAYPLTKRRMEIITSRLNSLESRAEAQAESP